MSQAASVFGGPGDSSSNFFHGLVTLRQLVTRSVVMTDAEYGGLHTPYPSGTSCLQPTEFEVELNLADIRYVYAISYDAVRVHAESLSVFRHRRSQRWFSRVDVAGNRPHHRYQFSRHLSGARALWSSVTRPRALFLTVAAQLQATQLWPLTRWFQHCLDLAVDPGHPSPAAIEASIATVASKNEIVTILKSAGLPIADIRMADDRRAVQFHYAPKGIRPLWISPTSENAGDAYALLILTMQILDALQQERLSLMDRSRTNLTPLIASFFLQLFTARGERHAIAAARAGTDERTVRTYILRANHDMPKVYWA